MRYQDGPLNLNLLTTQTKATMGIFPYQEKIPMVEPGIEPGTSWLVVRNLDHQTTRLVKFQIYVEEQVEVLADQKVFPVYMSAVFYVVMDCNMKIQSCK